MINFHPEFDKNYSNILMDIKKNPALKSQFLAQLISPLFTEFINSSIIMKCAYSLVDDIQSASKIILAEKLLKSLSDFRNHIVLNMPLLDSSIEIKNSLNGLIESLRQLDSIFVEALRKEPMVPLKILSPEDFLSFLSKEPVVAALVNPSFKETIENLFMEYFDITRDIEVFKATGILGNIVVPNLSPKIIIGTNSTEDDELSMKGITILTGVHLSNNPLKNLTHTILLEKRFSFEYDLDMSMDSINGETKFAFTFKVRPSSDFTMCDVIETEISSEAQPSILLI